MRPVTHQRALTIVLVTLGCSCLWVLDVVVAGRRVEGVGGVGRIPPQSFVPDVRPQGAALGRVLVRARVALQTQRQQEVQVGLLLLLRRGRALRPGTAGAGGAGGAENCLFFGMFQHWIKVEELSMNGE